ncbi:MAG: mercury methylation corrinoid protein HgcA [Candidatus Aminicenantales bacterium]
MKIRQTSSKLTFGNYLNHWLARWGVRRMGYRVDPGLYALGRPTPDSPVFVSANYTLSFDVLRAALDGMDGYILVLDTKGINVWCAASKGTFGTEELVRRIGETELAKAVNHRLLILPQLGASGVSAHEVKKRSGFSVRFGPVRTADLPEFLKEGKATEKMRQVRFGLRERFVLIPVELVHSLPFILAGTGLAFLVGGIFSALATVTSLVAGLVLFPVLLPWLPTRDFSSKGYILGGVAVLPFLFLILANSSGSWWSKTAAALTWILIFPSVTAFLALNFTGSTTFTSRTGVRREIFAYIPVMAGMFGAGIVLTVVLMLIRWLGGKI